MQIQRARSDEAASLTEIAFAAKRHWGYPESWIHSWRNILTMRPEFIAANIAFTAFENERAVGFYVLTTEPDGLHLDHLWIAPAAMGRGFGRALFQHAAAQAKILGCEWITIEADPNAEAFYERMGARRVGTSIGEVEGERRELPLMEYRVPLSS